MDDESEVELFPYIGAGPLKFGMSPPEVSGALGTPESMDRNHLGQRVEHRSFITLGYSQSTDGTLNHIGFARQMTGVRYRKLKIFDGQNQQVLRVLAAEDGNPLIYLGFAILPNLGFALTGFHDNDESQLAIILFPKGAWDARLPKAKRLRLG
jgi:hypothetical protein